MTFPKFKILPLPLNAVSPRNADGQDSVSHMPRLFRQTACSNAPTTKPGVTFTVFTKRLKKDLRALACIIATCIITFSCSHPAKRSSVNSFVPDIEALHKHLAAERDSDRWAAEEEFLDKALPTDYLKRWKADIYSTGETASEKSDTGQRKQAESNPDTKPETAEALAAKRRFRDAARQVLIELLSYPDRRVRASAVRLLTAAAVEDDELVTIRHVVAALRDPVPAVAFEAYKSLLHRFPETLQRRDLEFNPFEHDPARREAVLKAWDAFSDKIVAGKKEAAE